MSRCRLVVVLVLAWVTSLGPCARAEDVPDVLTRGLRERDGSVGRAILVYPNPSSEWWRGEIPRRRAPSR